MTCPDEVERILVEGDMAAAYVTMRGTHEGGLPRHARDAQAFAVQFVHLIRFADDGCAVSTAT